MIQGKQVTGVLHQGGDRFGAPYVYGSLDAFNVVLKAGGVLAVVADATTQNVGVGTSVPSQILHVRRDAAAPTVIEVDNEDADPAATVQVLFRNLNYQYQIEVTNAANAQPDTFRIVDNGAAPVTRFVLAPNGSIAVGPNSPDPSASFDLSQVATFAFPQLAGNTFISIPNPLSGLTSFDTTHNVVRVNVGTPGTPNFRKAAGGSIFFAGTTTAQSFTDGAVEATVTNWTTVQPGTNQDSAFNPVTGVFTAPVAGFYRFTLSLELASAAANLGATWTAFVEQDGIGRVQAKFVNPVAALSQTRQVLVTAAFQCAAGDLVAFRAQLSGAGGNIALSGNPFSNFVCGELVS